MADLNDPNLDLRGKKGSKVPLIVVAVLAVGGIGFFVFRTMTQRDERKRQATFVEDFARVEKEEVSKFWQCILGEKADAAAFPDNLALGARITSQFGIDAKNFPSKVREQCTPKAIDAKNKVQALSAPSEYEEPLKKYAASLKDLADAFDAWAKVAPAQIQDMQIAKKLPDASTAYHGWEGGKPTADIINYDTFLRCSVPTIDTLKDTQGLVELLFKECKKPEFTTKIVETCAKELIADPPPAPNKQLVALQKKLAADGREQSAFDDCLRKGRKGKRRDDLADIGKGWLAWSEAGHSIREIAKKALAD